MLGDKTFAQLASDDDFFGQFNADSNSLAVIVKHLQYNAEKFAQPKGKRHFTDEFLKN